MGNNKTRVLVAAIYFKIAFLRPKNFPNFFWLHLVPGTTIGKKIKKLYQIRGLPVDINEKLSRKKSLSQNFFGEYLIIE